MSLRSGMETVVCVCVCVALSYLNVCVCVCVSSPFKSSPELASRLCKAAMLSRFNLVVAEAERRELQRAVSYREAKVTHKRAHRDTRTQGHTYTHTGALTPNFVILI